MNNLGAPNSELTHALRTIIPQLFNLRYRQIKMIFSELRVYHRIILLVVLGLLHLVLRAIYIKDIPQMYYATGVLAALVYVMHSSRADFKFITLITPYHQFTFFIEYALLLSSCILVIVYCGAWSQLLVLLLLLGCISLIRKDRRDSQSLVDIKNTFLSAYISKYANIYTFEWIAAIRKYFWFVVLALLSSVLSPLHVVFPLLHFVIFLVLVLDVYQECEPLDVLWQVESTAKGFIRKKAIIHSFILCIFLVPNVFAFMIFHYQYWYVALYLTLLIWISLLTILFSKYQYYRPHSQISSLHLLPISLSLISVVLPFTFLVLMTFTIRNYKKSIAHMAGYLKSTSSPLLGHEDNHLWEQLV